MKTILLALVTVGLLVARQGVQGVPGSYRTFSELQGKYIPYNSAIRKTRGRMEECNEECVKDDSCNAYAHSRMENICFLYAKGRDQLPVKIDGYNLYVRVRDESDGFYRFGSHYIKLVMERKTYREAMKYCDENFYGVLPIITNHAMNTFMENMLRQSVVFAATIGVTDQNEEGKWVYSRTDTEIVYSNWNWKGQWLLKDRNCVTLTIDGTWVMSDCWQLDYFFCQVPLY
ncbi:collectin-10-like [Portunus trituberculatus]|uniref:collectin-10-like n=1 Tax=Portunus trituberculatus TaxID=210409 RepID=UPI001E1D14B0|nr:collectin-10-like [Portunus trituberculatus]